MLGDQARVLAASPRRGYPLCPRDQGRSPPAGIVRRDASFGAKTTFLIVFFSSVLPLVPSRTWVKTGRNIPGVPTASSRNRLPASLGPRPGRSRRGLPRWQARLHAIRWPVYHNSPPMVVCPYNRTPVTILTLFPSRPPLNEGKTEKGTEQMLE